MNLNKGFNREIFGYIRNFATDKDLADINPELIENIENDPDMLFITNSGLNPFMTGNSENNEIEFEDNYEISDDREEAEVI